MPSYPCSEELFQDRTKSKSFGFPLQYGLCKHVPFLELGAGPEVFFTSYLDLPNSFLSEGFNLSEGSRGTLVRSDAGSVERKGSKS